MKLKTNLAIGCLLLVGAWTSQAAISFSGSYSESFDSLIKTGTTQPWANDSTLLGWSLFTKSGAGITTYNAGDGGVNAGSFYSFGTGTATDRALGGTASGGAYFGSPASGAVAGYIAVALQNTSGSTFDSFTLAFVGEQWRNGGNATAQTMALQYGFGTSSFSSVTTWNTPGGSFDYASPVHTTTAAAIDGNVAGKVNGLGGTVLSQTWAAGQTLWIRWIENNDAGNDHGLAIDDFSITATAVPEPSTFIAGALLALPFGVQGVRLLRNRKNA